MARCPACGAETDDGAPECGQCHLARYLFDPVREAAGSGASDPKYLKAIGEILTAVDAPAEESDEETVSSAVLAQAARFPSIPHLFTRTASAVPAGPQPPTGLPALPPAGDVPVLLRQVNDYLQLARRQGIDLANFGERAREGVLSQDRESLELLSRDLFVHLAASITEQYEGTLARRHELAGVVSTATPDVELESCRAALALGDLAGAQRRLRHIDEELTDLEDHWATTQILITECDLLAGTIRELGGDPEPGLGPLAEGRRLARAGEREAAEPVLARGALALWSILDPIFMRELGRIKESMVRTRASGREVGPAVVHLRQLAADLRHRNFAAAIGAYRQLRAMVGPEPAEVPAPPTTAAG